MFKKVSISKVIIPFVLILIITSCTQQKQLVYLNNISPEADTNFFPLSQPQYNIQKQDILYIKVFTLNREVSDVINQTSSNYQQNLFQNETNLYINGYGVDDSGYVEVPVLGKIYILNKTIDEAAESVRERAYVFLKDPSVVVKLISFKFTVFGEVSRPGVYKNYNNQLTVLEAISMAGDITDFGNRRKVLVLRPSKQGTMTYRLDLTNKNILTSEGFFLLPNDIVYVEPIKSKTFKLNIPNISLALSTITTFILILNYIDRTNASN